MGDQRHYILVCFAHGTDWVIHPNEFRGDKGLTEARTFQQELLGVNEHIKAAIVVSEALPEE